MNPKKMDLYLRYLFYGPLYIYLFAFALGAGYLSGFIKPTTDILFYFLNPGEIAKFYIAGRFVSVIFGVLAVYMLYLIAKDLYDEETGLLSALIFSVTPMFVVNSHFMTVDVAMCFFVCLAFFMAVKILSSSRWKWYILAGISSGLAAAAKYNAVLILLIIPFADFMKECENKIGLIFCWFKKKAVVSYGCALGTFLLLCPLAFLNPKKFKGFLDGALLATGRGTVDPVKNLLSYLAVSYHGLVLPVFLLSVLGFIFAFIKRKKGDYLLLFWIIVNCVIVVGLFHWVHMRYLLTIIPFVVILAARALAAIRMKYGPRLMTACLCARMRGQPRGNGSRRTSQREAA